jgi:hypothetical protein
MLISNLRENRQLFEVCSLHSHLLDASVSCCPQIEQHNTLCLPKAKYVLVGFIQLFDSKCRGRVTIINQVGKVSSAGWHLVGTDINREEAAMCRRFQPAPKRWITIRLDSAIRLLDWGRRLPAGTDCARNPERKRIR